VVRDITAQEVTPDAGKGALGIWRWARGTHLRTEILVQVVNEKKLPHESDSKPVMPGEYVGKHLIFGTPGKAVGGHAIVANRTREIRPSGMKRGA